MILKKCNICGIEKPLSEYTPRPERPCGYYGYCKACKRVKGEKTRHSKNGLVSTMIRDQRKSCKIRGHEMPTYTLDELRSWVFSQPNFETLFNEWVANGYNKWLTPSIDRLNEKESYNFNNIRLVTWKENFDTQNNKHRAGILVKKVKEHKPVKATHLNTGKVLFFNSMASAERYFRAKGLSAYQGSISAVCRGRCKKHLNYKWEYADDNRC